ncbi:unnamed protein product [Acanthocheilonema viteae]|uniref:Ubiquinone biosynthesis protein COQ4 homolog, mitochondrial n=1 Tax=Acanthocheilonema viteae TaxID=6277 RepID=A0A498SUN4_ACAVI|nr:unnamed protein product [Acanthocheilonema viteae]
MEIDVRARGQAIIPLGLLIIRKRVDATGISADSVPACKSHYTSCLLGQCFFTGKIVIDLYLQDNNKQMAPNTLHIPTSALQKGLLARGSAVTALLNPMRADMVAAMGETAAFWPILEKIRQRMEDDICGRKILRDRSRITNAAVDLNYLRTLPRGTLGKEYSIFLERLNTAPDERPSVKFVDDDDLICIMQRYRETHDFIHLILQMKTTLLEEIDFILFKNGNWLTILTSKITVKCFEGIQLGLPMCILGGVFGGLRLDPKCIEILILNNGAAQNEEEDIATKWCETEENKVHKTKSQERSSTDDRSEKACCNTTS